MDPTMESELEEWIVNYRDNYRTIPCARMIKAKAKELSKRGNSFKASKGWYEKFMQRHFGIDFQKNDLLRIKAEPEDENCSKLSKAPLSGNVRQSTSNLSHKMEVSPEEQKLMVRFIKAQGLADVGQPQFDSDLKTKKTKVGRKAKVAKKN